MRFRVSAAIIVLATLCPATGGAQQYSFQNYGVDQGLADLAVRALYQDARGFLWLSTENGVFRYDGERFRAFGQADGLPVSNAAVFGEAPDGSLLVGGKFGLYQRLQADNRFRQVPMPGASQVMWGAGIQFDGRGVTYIATDIGLMELTGSQSSASFQLRLIDGPAHTGSSSAYGLLAENSSVWWGCGSEICFLADGGATVFGPSSGLPAGSWRGITREGNGDMWVQSVEGRVAVLRKETGRFQLADLPQLAGFGPRGLIKADTGGHIIIPVDDGLAIRKDGRWQLVGRAAGLRGPVYAALQDREGTLWLGLGGHGLVKWLGYGQWEYFNSDSGLGSDLAYGVTPAGDGAYWAATDAGLFLGRQTSTGWAWKRQATLGDLPIHSVLPDGHGKLWLGTEGQGAARMDVKTGQVEWFRAAQGLTAQNPYTIMIDRKNRIWAASMSGLFVSDGPTPRFRLVDGLPATFCLAVVEAPNGDIWAGTQGGLFQLSAGRWNRFTTADGLSNNEVLSLAAGTNGDIWVGYQFGDQIDRVHPAGDGLTVAHEKNGRKDTRGTTYFLGFDARGRLWAGTNRGVDVLNGNVRDGSPGEMDARRGGWDHYDQHDGLVWDDCDVNGFTAMPDGTVWIGTSGGLALFTPQDAASHEVPPVAILTKLTLGKQSAEAGRSISVDHTANSLTARFSALTFARGKRGVVPVPADASVPGLAGDSGTGAGISGIAAGFVPSGSAGARRMGAMGHGSGRVFV